MDNSFQQIFDCQHLLQVACCLQYWEPLIQQFIDYGEMALCENATSEMALPEVRHADTRDLVAATVWRLVIKTEDKYALKYFFAFQTN